MAANGDAMVVLAAEPAKLGSEAERRRCSRLPVNLPAVYRSANRMLDAQVSCLSWNGLRLSCSRVDRVGAEATVAISLPDSTRPLTVEGSVVWIHVRDEDMCEMGLRLHNLPRNSGLSLANYLLRSSHLQRLKH